MPGAALPMKKTTTRIVEGQPTVTAIEGLPAGLGGRPHALMPVTAAFPMKVNPYYLSLIERFDDPIGRQVLPDPRELEDNSRDADPLSEEKQSPTRLVIHRYPHRVVFLVSNTCAVICRFCMRKRISCRQTPVATDAIESGLAYIHGNRGIHEVILSGGDPLMLQDDHLVEILEALTAMEHVRLVRIHTRIPCVWPERISAGLAQRLSAFHPLFINIHFNHPGEITPQAARACALLADAGMPLGSQTVLLKGVNDNPEVLHALFAGLLEIRVRPYYLHQIDRVPGTAHFQVPLETGLQLMEALRGRLSGIAMPHYMIDLPGGGGKVELLPEAIVNKTPGVYHIRNFKGRVFPYSVA